MELYEVGGCESDRQLGLVPHDAVEAESFAAMETTLLTQGYTIFVRKPEYLTIRARKDSGVYDFVLCRRDGIYSDARRPDTVVPGTIHDDLARRDFRFNAMARSVTTGQLIDPHQGQADLRARKINCVGSVERLREDGLRVLRAFRFALTLPGGFTFGDELEEYLQRPEAAEYLRGVSVERIASELDKMLAVDTLTTLQLFQRYPYLQRQVFGQLRLRTDARPVRR
jgi:tRNA nucleotidyltransferase (CCA-adding enzyme)